MYELTLSPPSYAVAGDSCFIKNLGLKPRPSITALYFGFGRCPMPNAPYPAPKNYKKQISLNLLHHQEN